MTVDIRGEPVAAASRETIVRLDDAIDAYLGARADTRDRLNRVLDGEPENALARCLDGYLHMLSSRREGFARAREVVTATVPSTRRETLHLGALDAWSQGDMQEAARRWDVVLDEHPRDLVALKVSQFVLSYLGESQRMRETVERVLPAWEPDVPGYGVVLGCHAYALEEAGEYALAEAAGLHAVELNPADIWAAHAVAHVREMECRLHEGIDWIAALNVQWRECSNFAMHLRWHEGLFHLELDRHARVLELYDREVRAQSTDEYLDVTNAVSLLWRLEQAGVDVGARWRELADRASEHVSDHTLVFVDAHYAMALAAAGDETRLDEFLASCAHFADTAPGTEATVMREVGLPLLRAAIAHRRGSFGDVVDLLLPVHHDVRRIGGSHAQRDVFAQMLIDAAWRSGRLDVANELLTERIARRPRNVWAWKHRALVLDALNSSQASDAHRELDRLRAH
jgi:tetratricopeptide (TPR) repeat protein